MKDPSRQKRDGSYLLNINLAFDTSNQVII